MRHFFVILMALFSLHSFSQETKKTTSLEIYESIQKLNFFGNVMYVAAHPDDENTRLITYFSKHYHANTSYLSLTRGDGGQNLIGAELNEKLGLIRTQELIEARKIDGGNQFFTRAIDFGFSKTPEETLTIWDKQKVLGDLVFAIRLNKPDIIINRFDHRTPGSTHGHHTSSAMLSMEAFDLSGDASAFPEQLKFVEPWQPKAVYFNDSWFFYQSKEEFESADHKKHLAINIGEFYADQGLSNNEIAALSRSMHKSQGFGNTGTRGDQIEYLELLKGDLPPAKNVFNHIETSWEKLNHPSAKAIQQLLKNVEKNFNFQHPHKSLPQLIEAYQLLNKVENSFWKTRKSKELKDIIIACSGLFIEATTNIAFANTGQTIEVNIEATNQTLANIQLKKVEILDQKVIPISAKKLDPNEKNQWNTPIKIAQNQVYNTPFWLKDTPSTALYQVDDVSIRNLPELKNELPVQFYLEIENESFTVTRNLVYKYNDPVEGEVYEYFYILPPVSLSFENKNLVFSNTAPKQVELEVTNLSNQKKVEIELNAENGWIIEPNTVQIDFSTLNETKKIQLQIYPPSTSSSFQFIAKANLENRTYVSKVETIDYNHITKQKIIQPNVLNLIKLDIAKKGNKVGYVKGAGDDVAKAIAEIGYEVELFSVEEITQEKIANYDAIVMGIRAFNIYDELDIKKEVLFNYVKNGGNLIVQYNTSRGLKTDISPFPLQMSRNRVTNEVAKVTFISPNHPALTTPNTIVQADFDDWVQERGLYFPEAWSKEFTPILSMQDPDESAQQGSLLIAKYGKGYYTYTGLSFFRQLPAGVTGAYRLLANLLSLGNEDK